MKRSSDPHYRHRFPAEVINHAVWLYHVFSLSLCWMLSCFWLSVASRSRMRPCGVGVRSLAPASLTLCADGDLVRATSGIWIRSLSGSKAFSITCGVPSIMMVSC
ncbi:hypothetical protein ACMV_19700 [Acidiphilium multivorum AIU301]|uniref:Transposase n=1 Tax=Acidiphilium multivorum (strain DSM 11245 / JCM 8867 / NBRC 100883 / AIU 301) TaxID=926570 RepID=F0IZV7_ACIMA|nr:hypothetical protein ACMV_19700 [Acidiphilium multivorum AIU301]